MPGTATKPSMLSSASTPRGPDIWAQVDFACDEESALTVDDVLSRRTTLAVRGLASGHVSEAVRHRLGAPSIADTPSTNGQEVASHRFGGVAQRAKS